MDSLLSVPILYLLLLYTQLISADSSTGSGKGDDSSAVVLSQDANLNTNRVTDQKAIIRLLMMAAQNSNRVPNLQFRSDWGIPFRPARRIGSEFLGKRSVIPAYDEYDDIEKRGMGSEFLGKRRMGSEFLGKRRMGSEFLGKRGMGSEFLGKRGMGSEFLGKRGMGSEFLGKRGMGSEFLGKRAMGSEFLGKRGMGSEFLGKRRMGSEFLGKRAMGSEFLGKRGMGSEFLGKRRMGSEFLGKRRMGSEFLGKRDYDYDDDLEQQPLFLNSPGTSLDGDRAPNTDSLYNYLVEKRAVGSEFLGKRKHQSALDNSWKRGRLGSEFLGKRSTVPEQTEPYMQAVTHSDISGLDSNSTEEH